MPTPVLTAALAGVPSGIQAQGVWQGRRQLFVRFAGEAETATMYRADALAREIDRILTRSTYHSIAISGRDGQCNEPTQANAYSGKYPISRFLYVYVNKNPSAALDPVRGEFLKFVLSRSGQDDTVKDGYFPMPFVFAQEDRNKLGLGN